MNTPLNDFEALLREALTPLCPPPDLVKRLDRRFLARSTGAGAEVRP